MDNLSKHSGENTGKGKIYGSRNWLVVYEPLWGEQRRK